MKNAFIFCCLFFIGLQLNANCLLRGVENLETGSQRTDIAIGDFNRDGFSDVAIAGREARVVRVFLNQGDGSFALSFETTLKPGLILIVSADFNGDATPDLAVSGGGRVSIFLNDGTGKFSDGSSLEIRSPRSIAAADFNSDSKADLAVLTPDGVSVFQNANPGFTKTQTISVKSGTDLIAAPLGTGQFFDLILTTSHGSIQIYQGNGAGTFQQLSSVSILRYPEHLMAARINNDRLLDLVAGGRNGDVDVLIAESAGSFKRIQLHTASGIQGMALADFDDDHRTDLMTIIART
jgi:hypothetical protein